MIALNVFPYWLGNVKPTFIMDAGSSRRSILLHTNDMAEPVQPLNINTLHDVYVVEELIQLTIESNAEIVANSH